MQQSRIPATVTILTYNSVLHIRRCLESLRAFEEILILDGGSTDGTVDIAREFGARILPQADTSGPINDFTTVRIRSFDAATYDWIFWIDSDEWVDNELTNSVRDIVSANAENIVYRFHKIPVVDGRSIEHAYFLPDLSLRLIKRGTADWAKMKKVHEHLIAREGVKTVDMHGAIFSRWGAFQECQKKDKYYLHLAFSKPVKQRPTLRRSVRSITKNLGYALAIFCIAIYLSVRYRYTGTVLPFRYHMRFVLYHLRIMRERMRQYLLGTNYVPPKS